MKAKRFLLTSDAVQDIAALKEYLLTLPLRPASRIALKMKHTLENIGECPYQGFAQSELTRYLGVEVRSRLCHPYRIYYTLGRSAPEVFAILHGARDHSTLLRSRII